MIEFSDPLLTFLVAAVLTVVLIYWGEKITREASAGWSILAVIGGGLMLGWALFLGLNVIDMAFRYVADGINTVPDWYNNLREGLAAKVQLFFLVCLAIGVYSAYRIRGHW